MLCLCNKITCLNLQSVCFPASWNTMSSWRHEWHHRGSEICKIISQTGKLPRSGTKDQGLITELWSAWSIDMAGMDLHRELQGLQRRVSTVNPDSLHILDLFTNKSLWNLKNKTWPQVSASSTGSARSLLATLTVGAQEVATVRLHFLTLSGFL